MSRLDYRRKREKQIERKENGAGGFLAFIKEHTGLVCLIVILLLVVISAFIIGLSPEFKNHMSNDDSQSLYLDENTIFEKPYTEQEKTVLKTMANSVILCGKEKIVSLSENGEQKWEIDVKLNEPILSIDGNYILAADKGGNDIYLINGGKVILHTQSSYEIINAKVSSTGKFVIISKEPHFKGLASVKDAKGEEIFVWHSGSAYIIDAAIGSDDNKIALAVVNTTSQDENDAEAVFSSGVLMFNTYDEQPYKTHMMPSHLITNVYKADKGFIALTDKRAICLSESGEIVNEFVYENKSVNKVFKSDDILVLSLENENGAKSISAIDNKGKEKCTISVRQTPNFVSAQHGRIAYGGGSEIAVCDDAGKELYLIQTTKKYNAFSLLAGAKRAAGLTAASVDIIEIK